MFAPAAYAPDKFTTPPRVIECEHSCGRNAVERQNPARNSSFPLSSFEKKCSRRISMLSVCRESVPDREPKLFSIITVASRSDNERRCTLKYYYSECLKVSLSLSLFFPSWSEKIKCGDKWDGSLYIVSITIVGSPREIPFYVNSNELRDIPFN